MKRAKSDLEKVRDFGSKKTTHFHANPQRRKIPEKPRVPKDDRERFYGKERNSRAVTLEEAESEE